jgi:4-hydroxybenzoate polyprenyltransferase
MERVWNIMSSNPQISKPWVYAGKIGLLLDSIKFEHSIFALPFAYLGMLMASDGIPDTNKIVWITVAMVSARTLAMGANRYIDHYSDAQNPRTALRALPLGQIRRFEMAAMCIVSLLIFLFSASMLNELSLLLSPLAAIIIVSYSYSKRFTWLSHFWLGFADGLAPAGGWIAISNTITLEAIILCLAVSSWVAGFDLIYQCMDREFDIKNNLHTIPAKWGVKAALICAKVMHIITIISLITAGILTAIAWPYYVGIAIATALLIYEHSLVKPTDLSRITVAFFNINGYIALTVFVFTLVSIMII